MLNLVLGDMLCFLIKLDWVQLSVVCNGCVRVIVVFYMVLWLCQKLYGL